MHAPQLQLPLNIDSVKGFLAADEGEALFRYAFAAATIGPVLEIGSYCGKSTVYLGSACQMQNAILFAVDHHRGSEEHQVGEAYHDPELFDVHSKQFDSFRAFRETLARANLENTVVPVVAPSVVAARAWQTPLSMIFIDGGHSMQAALNDYESWTPHLISGGILAIHDVFPNPADGGRPPFEIWQMAKSSNQFEIFPLVNTLGVLKKKFPLSPSPSPTRGEGS